MENARGAPVVASARGSEDIPAVTSVGARVPALDGVRGVAILLVVCAHALYGVYPHFRPLVPGWQLNIGGGFTGVQLFFVLSGYLITSLLLRELERDGEIDWRHFYLRRIRRLYPALILVCLAYLGFVLAVGLPMLPALLEAARALTYTTNLPIFWHGVPGTGWLSHAWSLCVEEQFYLLWPLCLGLCWRSGRRAVLLFCVAAGMVAVLLRMLPLFEPLEYHLIRWDALLVGCLVALAPAWRPGRAALALGLLAFVAYSLFPRANYSTLDYLLASLGCAAFLYYALQARWVAHPVLRYFGRISYGLYLWHLLLLRPGWPMATTLLASVLVSELSFRYLERPLLAGPRRGPA